MHQWQFLCENRELLLHRMGHTPRAFVKTFGCQGNVADSEKIMGMLINMGCEQAEDEKQADIILYNTCAIRENAEIRLFSMVGELKRLKQANPSILIGLCGCMMQQDEVVRQIRKSYQMCIRDSQYSYINEVEETEATKALLDTYKEFTKMVDEANAITEDLDARYAAYSKAEAYMLQHAIVIPCNYQIGWSLSKVDNDTKMNAMYGSVNDKMKNWASNADGYTSEEKGVAEQVAAMVQE